MVSAVTAATHSERMVTVWHMQSGSWSAKAAQEPIQIIAGRAWVPVADAWLSFALTDENQGV